LYQGTALAGPQRAGLMRALAPEVRIFRPFADARPSNTPT
jgi:hypothetical protein